MKHVINPNERSEGKKELLCHDTNNNTNSNSCEYGIVIVFCPFDFDLNGEENKQTIKVIFDFRIIK